MNGQNAAYDMYGEYQGEETPDDGSRGDLYALEQQLEDDVNEENQAYTIYINDMEKNSARRFPSNYIRTSKYTILTFLPINFLEQLRRFSNVFFMLVAILAVIPGVTPLFWPTSVSPFVIVITVGAVKDAYEDYLRHLEDKKANRQLYHAIRLDASGVPKLVEVMSQDIVVGDICYILNKEVFPADMVILASSRVDGSCFVETSNLDGESNLKSRKAVGPTAALANAKDLAGLQAAIQCEDPNEHMYQFKGRLILGEFDEEFVYDEEGAVIRNPDVKPPETFALNHKQLLLRGAQLRNTKFVYAAVVYTGVITKLMLNQTGSHNRFSKFDRLLNKVVSSVFVLFFVTLIVCAILSGIFQEDTARKMEYLGFTDQPGRTYAAISLMTFFILYSYMIPISLFVTMEMVRFAQSNFMEWDIGMWSDPKDPETAMKARNSNINEELGQIEHIFSDKTGTLTQNKMKFVKVSVKGKLIDVTNMREEIKTNKSIAADIEHFLIAVCLCHTAVPEADDATGEILFNSQSPDETALLNGARDNGFKLISRQSDLISLEVQGEIRNYDVLATLEFNAARKRMSVIVKTPEGKYMLYCKGADSVIFERTSDKDGDPAGDMSGTLTQKAKDGDPHLAAAEHHLTIMAKEGMRTLVVGYHEIDEESYNRWSAIHEKAEQSIGQRQMRLTAAYEAIEKDLKLLGCTAIEDKLQDLVPDTIRFFNDAGVTLWLLTGDKQETAINIGYSSQILNEDMDLIIINVKEQQDCLNVMEQAISKYGQDLADALDTDEYMLKGKASTGVGLIINGESLDFALSFYANTFMALGSLCDSVICCRVTPGQKALVVRLAKVNLGKICLAIGDGANDVAMIQEANVGVGIMGREGTQAARAADFSVVEFRHLKRLLVVHGRYSYVRMATLVQYSFYKNLAFIFAVIYYQFASGASGITMYDSWVMTSFNIIFTSLPPLVIGMFEKDVDQDMVENHAELYTPLKDDIMFNWKTMIVWIFHAIWHSVVVYLGTTLTMGYGVIFSDGQTSGIWIQGAIASTTVTVTVLLRCALETKFWVWLNHLTVWASIAAYFIFMIGYSYFLSFNANMYMVFIRLLGSPVFWLCAILLVPTLCLMPDIAYKYLRRQYWPTLGEILQERNVYGEPKQDEATMLKQIDTQQRVDPVIAKLNAGFVACRVCNLDCPITSKTCEQCRTPLVIPVH